MPVITTGMTSPRSLTVWGCANIRGTKRRRSERWFVFDLALALGLWYDKEWMHS